MPNEPSAVRERGRAVRDGSAIAVEWHGMPGKADLAALERELGSMGPGARVGVLIVSTGSLRAPSEEERVVLRALRALSNDRDLALCGAFLAKGLVATILRALLPRSGELTFPDGSGRSLMVCKTREAALAWMERAGFGSARVREEVLSWAA